MVNNYIVRVCADRQRGGREREGEKREERERDHLVWAFPKEKVSNQSKGKEVVRIFLNLFDQSDNNNIICQ